MDKFRMLSLLAVLCCLAGVTVGANAAEVESGGTYCFCPGDFSESEQFSGIWILALPEGGQTRLGSRSLRPGDILTPSLCPLYKKNSLISNFLSGNFQNSSKTTPVLSYL